MQYMLEESLGEHCEKSFLDKEYCHQLMLISLVINIEVVPYGDFHLGNYLYA